LKHLLKVLVVVLLATAAASPMAAALGTAKISFTWDSTTSSLKLDIRSGTEVAAAQVKMEIPLEVTMGTASADGFLTGAIHVSVGTENRWFVLDANGMKEGGLTVQLNTPTGKAFEVTLVAVDLKDKNNNKIGIDTSLPITVNVGVVVSTTITSQTLSTTSSSTSTQSSLTTTQQSSTTLTTIVCPTFGQQAGSQEYSVSYANGANVKYTFNYPATVQPGTSFCITVIAQHLVNSPPASGVQLRFSPSPSSSVWIAGTSNVLSFGDLGSGIQARQDIAFTLSPKVPIGQRIQVGTESADASSVWRALSPDILVAVSGGPEIVTSTTTEVVTGSLMASVGSILVFCVIAIAALFFLTRRRRSSAAPARKPAMHSAVPFRGATPTQQIPKANHLGTHVPQVVGRREEEKK
jgi:hypothetical protein